MDSLETRIKTALNNALVITINDEGTSQYFDSFNDEAVALIEGDEEQLDFFHYDEKNEVLVDKIDYLELLTLTCQIFKGGDRDLFYEHECQHADMALYLGLNVRYGVKFFRDPLKVLYSFIPFIRIYGTCSRGDFKKIILAPQVYSSFEQRIAKTF